MTFNAMIPLTVALPLLGAAINFLLFSRPNLQRFLTIASMFLTLCMEIYLLFEIDANGIQVFHVGGWSAPFGINLVVDRLSSMLMLISSIISILVLFYATAQVDSLEDKDTPVSIFYPTYLILNAGVSDAFIAGDLFNLYVGFEILLTASYVLLTLGSTSERIRSGASYVVVSVISSLIFLISIAMIYGAVGTVNMAHLSERLKDLPLNVQNMLHAILLVAFGIKAAVFPLSFWLPDSYPTAPAPVTAVFAGLLTKVGIYSIIRTETLLFAENHFSICLISIGIITMLIGILGALAQSDLKRILSFTLISHVGYMLLGIGLHTYFGLTGAVYYMMHHIVVQTALFLVTGLISLKMGTTAISELGGLIRSAPFLSILFFIAAMNLGGIPPGSGFLGKVMILKAIINEKSNLTVTCATIAALIASILTLYSMARVWNRAFWRDPIHENGNNKNLTKIPTYMLIPTIVLIVISLFLTIFAEPIFSLSERAAQDLLNYKNYINLQNIHEVIGPTDD